VKIAELTLGIFGWPYPLHHSIYCQTVSIPAIRPLFATRLCTDFHPRPSPSYQTHGNLWQKFVGKLTNFGRPMTISQKWGEFRKIKNTFLENFVLFNKQ